MKSRKSILNKMKFFHKEVEGKKRSKTRLQTDQEFQEKKIFVSNKKLNVDMFLTAIRGGKAFAVEQKLRELKRTFTLKAMEKRLPKKTKPVEDNKSLLRISIVYHLQNINKHQMRLKKIIKLRSKQRKI